NCAEGYVPCGTGPCCHAATERCGDGTCHPRDEGGDGGDAGGTGSALLDAVQAAEYRTWARPPGAYEMPLTPARSPHGDFVDIYINDVVAQALAAETGTLTAWPEGSIIVKDGWGDAEGTDLRFLAIMEKRANGWYWEEFVGDLAEPEFSGVPDVCVDCHVSGEDFVRAFGLP
ncbi:MAG: cytochrome P460 family protein, partial [Myxococcales bacterium]|nr:cytochrome P460 family protein [Myxococcales bacterium]